MIIRDLEEITKFKENNIFNLQLNPFKSEIKSGLINLLSISNDFPYFIEKNFSIKNKESIEDIIIKKSCNNIYLYDYKEYLNLIKLLENHFEKFKLTKDLNLKETFLNIDIIIPTKDFEQVINRGRFLTSNVSLDDLFLEIIELDDKYEIEMER